MSPRLDPPLQSVGRPRGVPERRWSFDLVRFEAWRPSESRPFLPLPNKTYPHDRGSGEAGRIRHYAPGVSPAALPSPSKRSWMTGPRWSRSPNGSWSFTSSISVTFSMRYSGFGDDAQTCWGQPVTREHGVPRSRACSGHSSNGLSCITGLGGSMAFPPRPVVELRRPRSAHSCRSWIA
jgi:hypothetical protein